MPQPINRILPDPEVYLDANVLRDKPDFALIVCEIFATWAVIEQELNFLFYVVLGANAAPAIAIYSELKTQQLQGVALDAAAAAALSPDKYRVFKAATSVANSVRTPRNHLAHWAWGGCRQRPDILALCDPKMIKERDFRVAKHIAAQPDIATIDDLVEVALLHMFDDSAILAYTKGDLERALRDLKESAEILAFLRHYIDPKPLNVIAQGVPDFSISAEELDAGVMMRLNEHKLFREALQRLDGKAPKAP